MAGDEVREHWLRLIRMASAAGETALEYVDSIPMSFIIFGDEGIAHFSCSFESQEHKTRVFELMQTTAVALNAEGIILMGEAQTKSSSRAAGENDIDFRQRVLGEVSDGEIKSDLCTMAIYYDGSNVRQVITQRVPLNLAGSKLTFGKPTISDVSNQLFGAVVEVLPEKPMVAPLQIAAADWLVKNGERSMKALGVYLMNGMEEQNEST